MGRFLNGVLNSSRNLASSWERREEIPMFSGFPSVHFKIEATNIKYVRACGLKKLQLLCYFSVLFTDVLCTLQYGLVSCWKSCWEGRELSG